MNIATMNRRDMLRACAGVMGFILYGRTAAGGEEMRTAANAVDHLLLGVADLDYGMRWIEERTGIMPGIGGVHPGRGTRNALLSLGGRRYLEIIAPDPEQKEYKSYIDVRSLKEPTLMTWAASSSNIEALARAAEKAGYRTAGPSDGSRNKTDGTILRWRSLDVDAALAGSPVDPFPFFIQWADGSVHPSEDSPKGCELVSLTLEHPDAAGLKQALGNLGIEAQVQPGKAGKLLATIKTPRGELILS